MTTSTKPKIVQTGRWNDNIFTLDSNGHLVFSPMSEEELQNNPQPLSFYNQPFIQCIPSENLKQIRTIYFEPGCVCHHTTSLQRMFRGCPAFSINAEHLNVSSITHMDKMFFKCTNLRTLILPKNPHHLTSASQMFSYCSSLHSIDFSQWNTAPLEDMDFMFSNCTNLKHLDLSALSSTDTQHPRPISIKEMFSNCHSLESLNLFHGTFNFIDCDNMFTHCKSLQHLDLSKIHLTSIQTTPSLSTECMFSHCTSLSSLKFFETESLILNHTERMFENCPLLPKIELLNCSVQSNRINSMFVQCKSLQSITISNPCSFRNAYMAFAECSSLKNLDLSNWTVLPNEKYGAPNHFTEMFFQCSHLTDLTMFKGTVYHIKCNRMFENCESLTKLNLSSVQLIQQSKLHGGNMFCNCSQLQSVLLPTANNGNLTDPYGMFFNCSNLQDTLDLSTYKIKDFRMVQMFHKCENISKIILNIPPTLFNEDITDMQGLNMFTDCHRLTDLNIFPQINPKNYPILQIPPEMILRHIQSNNDSIKSPYHCIISLLQSSQYHTIIPALIEHYTFSQDHQAQLEKYIMTETPCLDPSIKAACMNALYQK